MADESDLGPELPILSWEQSAELCNGQVHPNTDEYIKPHQHRGACGHLFPCSWPGRGIPGYLWEEYQMTGTPLPDETPCQTYEHFDPATDGCSGCRWSKKA